EAEVRDRVIRDERSCWGGRVVEIEVEGEGSLPPSAEPLPQPAVSRQSSMETAEDRVEPSATPVVERLARPGAPDGAMDEEAFAVVEATLTELLAAAGFLVEVRRRAGPEMLFELMGDD